jgi:hypothetical protein
MHVVIVQFEPVPVKLYGGTERVVVALAQGLLALGHRVTLLSLPGDYTLSGVNFIDLSQLGSSACDGKSFRSLLPEDVDVIHFNLSIGQDQLDLPAPYVCTVHGNLLESEDLGKLPKNSIFVSGNHAKRHKREAFVYNGLIGSQIPLASSGLRERGHFAFLGRASLKRKGLAGAKRLAKKAQIPLLVGGGRGISLSSAVKFLGHLDDQQKFELLGGAKALLFPILWEEPFGLVMIEALFSGTPIFALGRGSVPEVFGQSGAGSFLGGYADNEEELFNLMMEYDYTVDPKLLRDYASDHFTHHVMSKRYEVYYRRVISGEELS